MNRRDAMLGGAAFGAAAVLSGPVAAANNARRAWDFTFTSLDGMPMPLSQWQGKVLLVVNTASFCGFTPQYEGLVSLWQDYRDRGLIVIGAPSTDFRQEYDEASEIKDFCEFTYGVDFPLTAPVHVIGREADPFFKWAAAETGHRVRWNFNKYLIGRDGQVISWMSSRTEPTSAQMRDAIEAALAAPAA